MDVTRKKTLRAGAALVPAAIAIGVALPAGAAPTDADTGAGPAETTLASYQGRTIDLSESWEGAKVCAVLTETSIQCFDSEAEFDGALGSISVQALSGAESESAGTAAAAASCGSGWLRLYDDVNFGGAMLALSSVSYWRNLTSLNFSNKMESWKNEFDCIATAADYTAGGGDWMQMAPNSTDNAVAPEWKNRASSVFV